MAKQWKIRISFVSCSLFCIPFRIFFFLGFIILHYLSKKFFFCFSLFCIPFLKSFFSWFSIFCIPFRKCFFSIFHYFAFPSGKVFFSSCCVYSSKGHQPYIFFSSSVRQSVRISVPSDCLTHSGEVRNDLFVRIERGHFSSKPGISGKNIEV